MALRYCDSFDHYDTATVATKWPTVVAGSGSTLTVASGVGRRSTACLRFTSISGAGGTETVVSRSFDNQATWIVGAAVRISGLPATTRILLAWYDGATTQCDLRVTPTGTLSVTRNGTVLGTTTYTLPTASYVFLEWAVTIHNTLGTTTVRVDGDPKLTLTTQDTQNTSNAFAALLRVGADASWSNTRTVDLDDLYVCDGTGAAPHNTVLGDCRVDRLLPTSDGTSQQWTPSTPGTHYTLVDETPPNTTDYVASSTVGHRDTYGMQDLTALTGTIYGVQVGLAALKSDAGARSLKPLVLSGASEALGAATALSTSQTYTLHVQPTDPATGAAWSESAINALQGGAEVA